MRKTCVWRDLLAAMVCLVLAFPVIWMLSTAFKGAAENASSRPSLIPVQPTLDNFVGAFTQGDVGRYLLNTVIVAGLTTLVAVAIAALAGYAFARLKFKGSKLLLLLIVASQMFPSLLLLMPLYDLMYRLGLIDTQLSLVLVYTTFALPFSVWMLRNYFISIPAELDEAAMIDGCTRLQALFRVVLPVARPGIVAVSVFCVILAWDDFIFANTFISTLDQRTLTVALQGLIGEFGTNWGLLMAGAIVCAAPILLLFAVFQRQLTSMVGGGVKG